MYPIITIGKFNIYVFPNILVFAMFLCIAIFLFSSKYGSVFYPLITKSMWYAIVGTVIGGKGLFALTIVLNGEVYSVFELFTGSVFLGGLIGCIISLLIFAKVNKISFRGLLDVYMSLIPLGQAIGRIGCYCNGCCYGIISNGLLSVKYVVHGNDVRVFPTWFVESLFCFTLFIIMFSISKRLYAGIYSTIYLFGYSVFRFIIEFLRGDEIRGVWNGFSTSQYICIGVFFVAIYMFFSSIKKKESNLFIGERD